MKLASHTTVHICASPELMLLLCVSRFARELLFSFKEILNVSDESPEHNTETVQIIPPRKQTSSV